MKNTKKIVELLTFIASILLLIDPSLLNDFGVPQTAQVRVMAIIGFAVAVIYRYIFWKTGKEISALQNRKYFSIALVIMLSLSGCSVCYITGGYSYENGTAKACVECDVNQAEKELRTIILKTK